MAVRMSEEQWRAFVSAGTRTGKLATTTASGQPHVVPIWFVLDVDSGDLVFTCDGNSLKATTLRRDPRVSICVDDERPPFSFVELRGEVAISEDLGELLTWATRIGGRYMGADVAEAFGRRNAVAGELLVRLAPTKVVALAAIAD